MRDFLVKYRPLIALLVGVVYGVSPLDGDFVPVIGWIDDFGVMGVAAVLAFWWWRKNQQASLPPPPAPPTTLVR